MAMKHISLYTPIRFNNVDESNSLNGINLDSSDDSNCGKTTFLRKGEVKIEEPALKEYRLIQVTGNPSDSFLNDITTKCNVKSVDFSNESSNESFDKLVNDESIKINEDIEQVENMAKPDLNPNTVLKESIQKFIAKAYASTPIQENGSLDEMSKTLANDVVMSSGENELHKVPESIKHPLFSYSNDSSAKVLRKDLMDDDTDIEILEVRKNNSFCVQESDQSDKHLIFKQENKRTCAQTDLKNVTDENEALNEDTNIDIRNMIKDASETTDQQVPMNSILSKLQPFSYSNTCLIREGKGETLRQNEHLKDSFTSNNVSHTSPDLNTLQVLKNSVNAEVLDPTSITKAESIEYSATSHNLLSGLEWNKKNSKLLDVCLELTEEVFPNKQDIPIQNDTSTPATIIPSIPIAHGFKSYRSYTSAEHLAYLHELAISKYSELKVPPDSNSCKTPVTPEAGFTQIKATTNFSKREPCQEIETISTVTVSAVPEDTHYKTECQNSSAENWSTQGRRNNSSSEYHGMIAPRLPIKPLNEQNSNVCTGYNISKMRPYAVHSLPKSTDSVPISPLPPPPTLSQLPPSSSSLSLASSFSIAHSMPPKHVATTDGQEWIMKLPETRKPMESLWPAYRPIYQPYTVYDSRFMQQRVQISQRPIMIAQPQSSVNPCLEQPHGCVNQYGGRFWGIYSPIAHRFFPRQTAHAAQQQRMSTANPDVVPHFIPHPTPRISTNHPVYISQLSKMSADVMPQYTSHSTESKCKSLEEIVGRIKENNKQ